MLANKPFEPDCAALATTRIFFQLPVAALVSSPLPGVCNPPEHSIFHVSPGPDRPLNLRVPLP